MDGLQLKVRAEVDVAAIGLSLAEALEAEGSQAEAAQVLSLLPDGAHDTEVALNRARLAIQAGDAKGALDVLVPLWTCEEAMGSIEDTLATVALALGMDETVESILEDTGADTPTLRWIQCLLALSRRTLPMAPYVRPTATSRWSLRQLLATLARLGRPDLVDACVVFLEGANAEDLADVVAGITRAPAPARTLVGRDPGEARALFEHLWTLPCDPTPVFNWAWTATRDVGCGEKVLVVGPLAEALKVLLPHAEVHAIHTEHRPGVDAVDSPDELELLPCRFDHVFAFDWLEQSLSLQGALERLVRATCHEGQLHLMCAGPAAEATSGLRLPGAHLRRMLHAADMSLDGLTGRDAHGAPAEEAEAVWIMARAGRWLFF